jgi:4-carboxymuconolactone decarboxylase
VNRQTESLVALSAALAADVSHWGKAPVAIQALGAWRKRVPSPEPATGMAETDWRARGEEVCKAVYGEKYALLREHVAALHPDLDDWMIAEGYGKVLGRPGLDLRTRELCAVAMLAGIHSPKQLHAHLRGAMHVGATTTDIEDALDLAGIAQGPARRAAAARVWHQVQNTGTASRIHRATKAGND